MGTAPRSAKAATRSIFAAGTRRGLALLIVALLGCSSESLDGNDGMAGHAGRRGNTTNQGGSSGQGGATAAPSEPAAAEALALLPDGARLTTLYTSAAKRSATALGFNPNVAGELWVTLRQFPVDAPCTAEVPTGCRALVGEVALIAALDAEPSAVLKQDGNAWHFMRRPTSIAFGDNGNLATCPEARTSNYSDEAIDYTGPTLWSSDPAIFGVKPQPGQNGTHLDMLHATPFCMGIAHERDNVYWTFNGKLGALDRYDFKEPHEIGGEYHSDAELYRYVEGELARVPEVPSHLALDRDSGSLFIADTGHSRVARLNIRTGTMAGALGENYDALEVAVSMASAELSPFVAEAELVRPSGLAIHRGVLLVTDNATSRVHAFGLEDGAALRTHETGLPEGSLAGIAVGPDGKVYLSDLRAGAVHRVDP